MLLARRMHRICRVPCIIVETLLWKLGASDNHHPKYGNCTNLVALLTKWYARLTSTREMRLVVCIAWCVKFWPVFNATGQMHIHFIVLLPRVVWSPSSVVDVLALAIDDRASRGWSRSLQCVNGEEAGEVSLWVGERRKSIGGKRICKLHVSYALFVRWRLIFDISQYKIDMHYWMPHHLGLHCLTCFPLLLLKRNPTFLFEG
jgi:hypothetical protein